MRDVASIPQPRPPKPRADYLVGARLNAEQKAMLERARLLLSQKWNRKTSNTDVVIAAIEALLQDLQAEEAATLTAISDNLR